MGLRELLAGSFRLRGIVNKDKFEEISSRLYN